MELGTVEFVTDESDQEDPRLAVELGTSEDSQSEVIGRRVALVGRFGGMNQREAANVLRSYDAIVVDTDAEAIDWIVIGAEEAPLAESELLSQPLLDAAASGSLEILHETDLWQRLGLVDIEQSIRRYYTPAKLAHLLGVSVRVIRRWHRRGLITPVRTLHKLPYFDFQEVATARRLAQWIASGASPQAIEQRLVEVVEVLPDMRRPLDQLSILVEGKQVLLRQGEGLLEPGGQLRFDFDSFESDPKIEDDQNVPSILMIRDDPTESPEVTGTLPQDGLMSAAYAAEDSGDLEAAVDYLHAVLARDGPRPEIDFQLGELLYRMGYTIAARERYYSAIERDPEFVEARASLGSVLAEAGQRELAVAAFRGALSLHHNYADVHYNLAQVLEELGRDIEARHHWNQFLSLAPDSPWAAEAIARIEAINDPHLDR